MATFYCNGCGAPGVVRTNCPHCSANKTPVKTEKFDFCTLNVMNVRARPVVPISVNDIHGFAFIDTCAKTSVASYTLYQQLQQKGYKFRKEKAQISMADGIPRLQTVQLVTVPVTLCGRTIATNFVVLLESQDNRTLLGIGFLEDAGIILDLSQFTWHFNNAPNKIYKLYDEEIVTFKKQNPVAQIAPKAHGEPYKESTRRWKAPAKIPEASLPKQNAVNANYKLFCIDFTEKTKPPKRPKTVFDGYSPYADYMMRDAQINIHRLDVELSPHSKSLFPGPDPYSQD